MEASVKNYLESMNKVFILSGLIILGTLFGSCKNALKNKSNKQIEVLVRQDSSSVPKDNESRVNPDTTINKRLILDDANSTEDFYPDYKNLFWIEGIREQLVSIFSNKSKSQYLLAYFYEGSSKNAFDCFEIGYWTEEKKLDKQKYFKTKEAGFETESGIKLGMSLADLIQKKGSDYKIETQKDTIITYRIDNQKESDFLQRYRMPGYFMSFTVKDSKICHIMFGFDYP